MGLEVEGDKDKLPLTDPADLRRWCRLFTSCRFPRLRSKDAVLLAGIGTAGETTVIERGSDARSH